MVLFTTLTVMLAALFIGVVLAILFGGGAFLVMFADVIVCAAIIALIVRFFIKRGKKGS